MHLPPLLHHESESHKHKKNYVIGKKIGEGGYATVFEAHDNVNNRTVAMKIAPKKFVKTPANQLWIMETMTTRIHHPHIVRMWEWWESQHNYYMVFEMAEGGELFDRLLQVGAMPEAEVRQIILALLDALRYVHSQKIIHRDMKPENVLIKKAWTYNPADADGSAPIIVSDFGLAVELPNEGDLRHDPCGSPVYAAPEVYAHQGYSYPADIWSIGIIAFALLSGHYPWNNTELPAVLEEAQKCDIHFPDQPWSAITPEAKDFILAVVKVDPAERPTAARLLEHPWLCKPAHTLQQAAQIPAGKSPMCKQLTLVSVKTEKMAA